MLEKDLLKPGVMANAVLEESEFEPMFSECEEKLEEKKVVLFGSYGWETDNG